MQSSKFISFLGARLAIWAAILILGSGVSVASTYETLLWFGGVYGRGPTSLISDADGNLYGTTDHGGTFMDGGGTVFKLAHNPDGTWTPSVLQTFYCQEHKTGCSPRGALVFDSAGNLYGTTAELVFKLAPNPDGSWTETVVHRFSGVDGSLGTGLVRDAAGNLYGAASQGGGPCVTGRGCGTIFKLTANPDGSWTYSVLHGFTGGDDGAFSNGALIFDNAGAIYGTTSAFGSYGYGNVFKLAPESDGTWTETVLHQFTGAKDGAFPEAGLIFDATGHLYGTASQAGIYGVGLIFRLTKNLDGTWTENVLYPFTFGRDGADPVADLILDASGNLYGTAPIGGSYGYGVVFKLVQTENGGWVEKVLWSFRGHPAGNPRGRLLLDGNGNLYGTSAGLDPYGPGEVGNLFEITP